jgi:DNA-binding response OmpR family regulator
MASAFPDTLLHLLLERLDAEPAPVLSGVDVARYSTAELERLLELRLLTETAQLEELGPCECGVDGCWQTVHRDEGRLLAVCQNASLKPRALTEDQIRQFRIETTSFHQYLRKANRLDGDAITEFTRTICFLGQASLAGRKVPIVLARCLSARSAESALFEIRGRLPNGPLIVLTPTMRALDLHTQHHLKADSQVLASVAELRISADSLLLDRQRLEGVLRPKPLPFSEAVLSVDVTAHQAHFRGVALSMPPRAFQVLVLLARQAMQTGDGWVRRDTIYETLWPDDNDDKMVYDRQIDDTVKELRRALDSVEDGAGNRLVETGRRVGYRLQLSPPDLALR